MCVVLGRCYNKHLLHFHTFCTVIWTVQCTVIYGLYIHVLIYIYIYLSRTRRACSVIRDNSACLVKMIKVCVFNGFYFLFLFYSFTWKVIAAKFHHQLFTKERVIYNIAHLKNRYRVNFHRRKISTRFNTIIYVVFVTYFLINLHIESI